MNPRYTLIAPMDTLTGVDLFDIALTQKWSVQCFGVFNGWRASLNDSELYPIESATVQQLKKIRQGHQREQSFAHLNPQHSSQFDVGQLGDTVYIANLPGEIFRQQLRLAGKTIIELKDAELEHFAEQFGITLTPAQQARAIYHRDYLPGLTANGIAYGQKNSGSGDAADVLTISYHAIREQENNLEGTTELWSELTEPGEDKELWEICVRDLIDLDLVLAPEKYRPVLMSFLNEPFFCQTDDGGDYQKKASSFEPLSIKPKLVLYFQGEGALNTHLHDRDFIDNGHRSAGQISTIEYVCHSEQSAQLETIIQDEQWRCLFTFTVNRGKYTTYFKATLKQRDTVNGPAVEKLVNHLLTMQLLYGRPLRHYGCTFFLPFEVKSESEVRLRSALKLRDYQSILRESDEKVDELTNIERTAYLYFDPEIRERIYNFSANSPTDNALLLEEYDVFQWQYWELTKVRNYGILNKRTRESDYHLNQDETLWQLRGEIQKIRLYKFYNDVFLLGVTIANQFSELSELKGTSCFTDDDHWWLSLIFSDDETFAHIQNTFAGRWLEYTQKIREIHTGFALREHDIEDDKAHFQYRLVAADDVGCERDAKDKKTLCKRVALYHELYEQGQNKLPDDIEALFNSFFETDKLREKLHPLIDNRMFVNASYAQAGQPNLHRQGEQRLRDFLALAAYVDSKTQTIDPHDTRAYDQKFTDKLLAAQTYTRWCDFGSLYAFTDYSNVYVGHGWNFSDVIGPEHVFYNYERMLVFALFYHMSLHHYSRKISEASHLLLEKNGSGLNAQHLDKFQSIKRDFIQFTNYFWFEKLTEQIQGKEIFALQVNGLQLKKEYQLIEQEIESTDQYMQSLHDQQQSERGLLFTQIAGILTIAIFVLEGVKLLLDGSVSHIITGLIVLLLISSYANYALRGRGIFPNGKAFIDQSLQFFQHKGVTLYKWLGRLIK
ncbi:hypothetical protein [Vibrio spartinae]|uniref:Uncharacterized protein n=1 Tax=Vibrio spartinae TaxID=1918945 RepID=A0ABX6R484_9VIBR|nr:hypothetical protein [Vibrio spartinae]QMV16208.1 hypothetical protein Vspart_03593 [Vibrio spartinae]